MERTTSAGGVILNKYGQILVISQGGRTWSLPKGHVDAGETPYLAAQREISEEAGITELEYIKDLGNYKRYKIGIDGKDDKSELKEIYMYLFRTNQEAINPTEGRWVNKEEVASLLTHPKDKEFFKSILQEIKYEENFARQK